MNVSSTTADARETGPDGGGGTVVLLSVWWKNPFLWMILGIGGSGTIMAAMEGGERMLALVFAALTVVFSAVAHLSLCARLEIRPDGFREEFVFWRTIERVGRRWESLPCARRRKRRMQSASWS